MSITAAISAAELTQQVTDRFVDRYLEAWLVNLPGTTYDPSVAGIDATFLAGEIPADGGYERQAIAYSAGDVNGYSDDGVALATKIAIFSHDGSADLMTFTHCMLVWGSGQILTIGANVTAPTSATDGAYYNIPTTTDGAGIGLRVNVTVVNSGASTTDYAVSIAQAGSGYAPGDAIVIPEASLESAGMAPGSADSLSFAVGTVNTDAEAGNILAVAETTGQVSLINGREAAFYFNLKQFGFNA